MEEHSDGRLHKSEPEPLNESVNAVCFMINRARGNTRISRTEFVYDERAHDCKCLHIFELPAQNMFGKKCPFTNVTVHGKTYFSAYPLEGETVNHPLVTC